MLKTCLCSCLFKVLLLLDNHLQRVWAKGLGLDAPQNQAENWLFPKSEVLPALRLVSTTRYQTQAQQISHWSTRFLDQLSAVVRRRCPHRAPPPAAPHQPTSRVIKGAAGQSPPQSSANRLRPQSSAFPSQTQISWATIAISRPPSHHYHRQHKHL